jgi:uncharacterized membrane protein
MSQSKLNPLDRIWPSLLEIALASGWWLLVVTLSSRSYFLVNYGAMRSLEPMLEPFGSTWFANIFAVATMGVWLALHRWAPSGRVRNSKLSVGYLAVSLLPALEWAAHWSEEGVGIESLWPTYWVSIWTGLSFAAIGNAWDFKASGFKESGVEEKGKSLNDSRNSWIGFAVICGLCLVCGVWWTAQSFYYYDSFMLGFNDFGHFMQRVANTADGRGFLLETPVLPAFWDHFNPGLVMLVPLWKLFPDVTLAFYLQSVSLVSCALLVWRVSHSLGHSAVTKTLWSAAWLFQPILGQMNLAYTYGWHPISFAIPLLLVSMLSLQQRRYVWAGGSLLVALTIEEGVFVIAALFCALNAAMNAGWLGKQEDSPSSIQNAMSWRVWAGLCILLGAGFILVFRWSGLAEFQTARFASLGSSPLAVLMSPFMKPQIFWGHLFSLKSAYFVLGLFIPCFLPSLVRGWRFLLSVALPLGVLLVWEHRPAQSLAFQYASTLLPILWFATMVGSQSAEESVPAAPSRWRWLAPDWNGPTASLGAFSTAWVFSLFLGQFPYSSSTLQDVSVRTYQPTETGQRLQLGSIDNQWLHDHVSKIRNSQAEVLATGRIASHCVGNRDVETVGQYVQRKGELAELSDRLGNPILHYRWLVLDRLENFQQNSDEIQAVEREAINAGFEIVEDRYGIAVYSNRNKLGR